MPDSLDPPGHKIPALAKVKNAAQEPAVAQEVEDMVEQVEMEGPEVQTLLIMEAIRHALAAEEVVEAEEVATARMEVEVLKGHISLAELEEEAADTEDLEEMLGRL